MTRVLVAAIVLVFGQAAHSQSGPVFDAVSVKPSPPYDPRVGRSVRSSGGPGTADPGLYTCENCSLANLLSIAYGLPQYRITGPEWMPAASSVVTARVPKGATKEQFQTMMQTVLAERFKLVAHREQKQMEMYDLVAPRGGSKLKAAADERTAEVETNRPRDPIKLGADGYPALTRGTTMAMMNGRARIMYPRQTMEWLAEMLSSQLGVPVTDATGLAGNYEVSLFWGYGGGRNTTADAEVDAGPTIFEAVQSQLGLKLERKKGPVEILVVDHVEKTPSEN